MDGYHDDREIRCWSDDDEGRLERHITEIAIEIAFLAEVRYRDAVRRHHEWRIKRKAEEEEERKRKIAVERAEWERREKLRQECIDRLLRQTSDLRKASEIRRYAQQVRDAKATDPAFADLVDKWSAWALAQADRIDPTLGDRFMQCVPTEDLIGLRVDVAQNCD